MKKLSLFSLILVGVAGPAAAQVPGKTIKTYTTPAGRTYQKGDTLHFALGIGPDGNFRYAYLPPNQWLGTTRKPLTSTWNNLNPVIKDLRQQKTVTGELRTVAVITAPGINACVELESAEQTGELCPTRIRQ